MSNCSYCVNKEACTSCNNIWHDKFIPNDDVKKFFNKGYNGVRGINGYTWDFDTTNEDLIPTHSVLIYNSVYCPYCGEKMFPIQDGVTLDVMGYCCICEGARAELEYKKKLGELKNAYELDCSNLRAEYFKRLEFNTDKLLSIKHKIERGRSRLISSHFTTINGQEIHDVNQL